MASSSDTTARLPEKYSRGSEGGLDFLVEHTSGKTRLKRESNRATTQPDGEWGIGHLIKSKADFATLQAFLFAHEGGLEPFRFKDWNLYQASDALFATGDDATSAFQLVIPYAAGAQSFDLKITRPCESQDPDDHLSKAFTVKAGTTLGGATTLTENTHYEVDYATGIVTFLGAWSPLPSGNFAWWSGDFDFLVQPISSLVRMRFDSINARSVPDIVLEKAE